MRSSVRTAQPLAVSVHVGQTFIVTSPRRHERQDLSDPGSFSKLLDLFCEGNGLKSGRGRTGAEFVALRPGRADIVAFSGHNPALSAVVTIRP